MQCDLEGKIIWNWAIKKEILITAAHIPGALITDVAEESIKSELRIEWKLNEIFFTNILDQFVFYVSPDLFGFCINTQLKRFFPYQPDPDAEVINALCIMVQFKVLLFFIIFMHWKVLQKIYDKAEDILILPN